tara:strand:- start:21 stop:521 length:501 start_codon:yes stop_codon:yes gene_type:complete
MSKKIIKIEQIDKGGLNESGIEVDKLWELHFENQINPRILDSTQILHYLTKGTSPSRNIHHFRKWESKCKDTIHNHWCIVYSNPIDHSLLLPNKFYDLIYEGHRKEQEELNPKVEVPPNPAIFTEKITTTEEKKEIKDFRDKFDPDEAFRIGLHLHDDEIEEAKNE